SDEGGQARCSSKPQPKVGRCAQAALTTWPATPVELVACTHPSACGSVCNRRVAVAHCFLAEGSSRGWPAIRGWVQSSMFKVQGSRFEYQAADFELLNLNLKP